MSQVRHERWRRLSAQVLRESGRTDPLIDREGVWSSGERIGDWGLSVSATVSRSRMAGDYTARRRALISSQREALAEFDRKQSAHFKRYDEKNQLSRQLHVEVSPDCVISFSDGANRVELSRFIGKRRDFFDERRTKRRGEHAATVLINGDGFDLPRMQTIQAELRRDYTREFGVNGVMVVPYQALTAAGIVVPTIKRIAVTRDGGENVVVQLKGPAKADIEKAVEKATRQVTASMKERDRYWITGWEAFDSNGDRFQVRYSNNGGRPTRSFQVMRQPLDGILSWQNLGHSKENGWFSNEFRHRLGASVFSAVDGSGSRHRFLSAFDVQEQPPLYFLAQLPDEGRVLDFSQALDLLAPPLVHQARKDGKLVFRQGDVFFVQTELTIKELRQQKAKLYSGERSGGGPTLGRNIYLTGHIATRVAVLPNGVTFAQGVVSHFPAINDATRVNPDHRPLTLHGDHFYLCLRNTVPRSGAAPAVVEETEGGGTNARNNIAA